MLARREDRDDPMSDEPITDAAELRRVVSQSVDAVPVLDMHTHLFPPSFGELNLWGADDLLTYHYLTAELLRHHPVSPAAFAAMPRAERADMVWDTLFVRNTPLSQAARGVVAVFSALGLDPRAPDLREARAFFERQDPKAYCARVLDTAGVADVVMTNDPFDPAEWRLWASGVERDPRFHAVLRMDPLLNAWQPTASALRARGYETGPSLTRATVSRARRFLEDAIARTSPRYLAASLPDDFAYPEVSERGFLLDHVVLPTCRDHGLPFAMMIGVRRGVNPDLGLAGDGLGRASVDSVVSICADNADIRFLVTMLSRENQHELVVAARKFRNLMPFGCWWFLNNPSICDEITRERLEMLGTTFIPHHSDARVLDQLLSKWPHARRSLTDALTLQYAGMASDGRGPTRAEIARDAHQLLRGNAAEWLGIGTAGGGDGA